MKFLKAIGILPILMILFATGCSYYSESVDSSVAPSLDPQDFNSGIAGPRSPTGLWKVCYSIHSAGLENIILPNVSTMQVLSIPGDGTLTATYTTYDNETCSGNPASVILAVGQSAPGPDLQTVTRDDYRYTVTGIPAGVFSIRMENAPARSVSLIYVNTDGSKICAQGQPVTNWMGPGAADSSGDVQFTDWTNYSSHTEIMNFINNPTDINQSQCFYRKE